MWLTEKPKVHVFCGTLGWWSFFTLIFWEMASGSLQVTILTDTSGLFLKLSELDKNRTLSLVTGICPVCRNAQGRCSILGPHCIKMSYSHLLTDYGTIHPQTPWNLNATGIFCKWVTSAYCPIPRDSDFLPLSRNPSLPRKHSTSLHATCFSGHSPSLVSFSLSRKSNSLSFAYGGLWWARILQASLSDHGGFQSGIRWIRWDESLFILSLAMNTSHWQHLTWVACWPEHLHNSSLGSDLLHSMVALFPPCLKRPHCLFRPQVWPL